MEKVRPWLNYRPRAEAIRLSGVKPYSFYSAVWILGGTVRKVPNAAKELPALLREHYHRMGATAFAEKFGYKYSTVNNAAKRLGLYVDPDVLKAIRLKYGKIVASNPEYHAKSNATKKRQWKMERNRVWLGLRRKTKWNLGSGMPRRIYMAIWYRTAKMGYKTDPSSPYTLIYDDSTRRCNEKLAERKFGLKFKPAAKTAKTEEE